MRSRVATICLVACGILAVPALSFAEPKRAASGTPVAGQQTSEAAQARRLFDAERWSEASLGLKRVVDGDTGDDEGNRQLAQYQLAICLYRLGFNQASFGLFSIIAEKPTHPRFNETLPWLAKLATQLPEPADVIERVGKYGTDAIARFDNAQQRELYWQLNYLLGRYRYRNRSYADAVALLEKVDQKSRWYVEARFFAGISYVQLRKSVPAVKSFQKVLAAIDDGVALVSDEARMRDLARLSIARTYYSASVRLDDENRPRIDSGKLGRGEVLEPRRRPERVLDRRAVRGVVGVLHGR